MNKELIEKLNSKISQIENSIYEDEEKYEYLKKYTYTYQELSKLSISELFKVFYLAFTNISYQQLNSYINYLEEEFNKIEEPALDSFKSLLDDFDYYLEKEKFDNLFIKAENKKSAYKIFESLDLREKSFNILEFIFSDNEELDYEKYNLFLKFFDHKAKIVIGDSVSDIIEIKILKRKFGYQKIYKDKNITEMIKKGYPDLFNIIDELNKTIHDMKTKIKKNKSNTEKKLETYKNILNNINLRKHIDLKKIENYIDDSDLLSSIIIYNCNVNNEIYFSVKDNYNSLNNNEFSKKDEILSKLGFKLNINKIEIENEELERKLKEINKYFPELKKYNNIVLKIINNLEYHNFIKIIELYKTNDLTETFILNNIDIITNKETLNNLLMNIELLKSNNINILRIIKYDESILYINYNKIKNIVDTYLLYGINLNNDYYNFEFLKEDYSYIIDKFIEIGEYNLIQNNASLISNNSDIIIKRCLIYKEIGNNCLNEQEKLRGSLRKEDNFILTDDLVKETIIDNYDTIIPEDILNVLKLNNCTYLNDTLDILDKYKLNDISYKFDNIIISKYKVIKNINKLIQNNLNNKYSYSDLLIYSILYNYPNTIDTNILNNVKEKAKILK